MDEDFLNVAVGEIGIGAEDQGGDSEESKGADPEVHSKPSSPIK